MIVSSGPLKEKMNVSLGMLYMSLRLWNIDLHVSLYILYSFILPIDSISQASHLSYILEFFVQNLKGIYSLQFGLHPDLIQPSLYDL